MADTDAPPLLKADNQVDDFWKLFIDQSDLITQPVVVQGTTPGPVITCSSTRYFGCTFSTAKVLDSFEIAPDTTSNDTSLVFGLDTITNKNITVSDILTAFVIPNSDLPGPVGFIISALSKKVDSDLPTFQIDNTLGSKNGIWVIPIEADSLEVGFASF
jgi:hypothetical protein